MTTTSARSSFSTSITSIASSPTGTSSTGTSSTGTSSTGTSSPATSSAQGRSAAEALSPSTGLDPGALIIGVAGQLTRSADPETVFGSLAAAYAWHTGTECAVELLSGSVVRVISASPVGSSTAPEPAVSEQPTLSPVARQLLAGDGTPLSGPDWFALPIGASASQDTSADIPVGVFHCRFTNRRAEHNQLEPARFLLTYATELLQAERRLATAERQVANLEVALSSNRDIGTAIGILMNAHLVTQEQAFAMLRTASQHGHRKLREIANEVIFTGSISTPPAGRA